MQYPETFNNQSIKGLINFSLLILYCSGIFWLSDQPSLPAPSLFKHQDKLFHVGAYFIMGLLAWRSFHTFIGHPILLAIVTLTFCSLYGWSDEWHQSFVSGRYASFADWLADTTGAILSIGLMLKINSRKPDSPISASVNKKSQ